MKLNICKEQLLIFVYFQLFFIQLYNYCKNISYKSHSNYQLTLLKISSKASQSLGVNLTDFKERLGCLNSF